jgi:calcineurin-like phosphoesterase family protein
MRTYFTSDQHFGHKNIIAYSRRPFRDMEEMTRELIARHNAVVGEGDVVIHVGDFSLDDRLVAPVLRQLRGRHRLVAGNHDTCHPVHSKHVKKTAAYLAWGFESVDTRIDVGPYLVCHLPYEGDHGEHEERFPEWRPADEGRWLLHGHVHEAWGVRGRMVNVGVDARDYRPITLEAVDALVAAAGPANARDEMPPP